MIICFISRSWFISFLVYDAAQQINISVITLLRAKIELVHHLLDPVIHHYQVLESSIDKVHVTHTHLSY
jgi:hypothetical protein